MKDEDKVKSKEEEALVESQKKREDKLQSSLDAVNKTEGSDGLTKEEKEMPARKVGQKTVQEELAERDNPDSLKGLGSPSTPAVDTAMGPGTVKSGEGLGTVSVPHTGTEENPGSNTLVAPTAPKDNSGNDK